MVWNRDAERNDAFFPLWHTTTQMGVSLGFALISFPFGAQLESFEVLSRKKIDSRLIAFAFFCGTFTTSGI